MSRAAMGVLDYITVECIKPGCLNCDDGVVYSVGNFYFTCHLFFITKDTIPTVLKLLNNVVK